MASLVYAMFNAYGIPRALIMHVGWNDIGAWSTKRTFISHEICIVCYKKNMLPDCTLIFSSILPRSSCRYSLKGDAMEKSRTGVNRGVRSYLQKIGGIKLYLHLIEHS